MNWDLAFCEVCWIPFSDFREVENISTNRRPGGYFVIRISLKNTNLVEDIASCLGFLNSVKQFQRRSRKCLRQLEARVAILFFGSAEVLLPVKLIKIPFSVWRGEVDVLSNQRPEWQSFFRSAQKLKLGRGRWDLASCQVSLNSVQRFQRRSRKYCSQSEAGAAIFTSRSKLLPGGGPQFSKGTATPMAHIDPVFSLRLWRIWG